VRFPGYGTGSSGRTMNRDTLSTPWRRGWLGGGICLQESCTDYMKPCNRLDGIASFEKRVEVIV